MLLFPEFTTSLKSNHKIISIQYCDNDRRIYLVFHLTYCIETACVRILHHQNILQVRVRQYLLQCLLNLHKEIIKLTLEFRDELAVHSWPAQGKILVIGASVLQSLVHYLLRGPEIRFYTSALLISSIFILNDNKHRLRIIFSTHPNILTVPSIYKHTNCSQV